MGRNALSFLVAVAIRFVVMGAVAIADALHCAGASGDIEVT
jgi:hypothetical protein